MSKCIILLCLFCSIADVASISRTYNRTNNIIKKFVDTFKDIYQFDLLRKLKHHTLILILQIQKYGIFKVEMLVTFFVLLNRKPNILSAEDAVDSNETISKTC